MKKDIEIAEEFFQMLKRKGFEVSKEDFQGNSDESTSFNDRAVSFELKSESKTFLSVDFVGGKFYRISGFESGFWRDEIDGVKYT